MPTWILVICIIVFGLTLWAGLYLISRDHKNPRLDFAGLGTVLFVLSLGSAIIDSQFSPLPILHITLTVPALGLISLAAFLSIRAASQPSLATAPRRLKNTFLFTLV
ncbi:MAG: hypothetical protein J2P37_26220, partial [Ktedonobacteraceae bacterium]|nr:hypothetical protein [Ktedonobacteraceae bacterium]